MQQQFPQIHQFAHMFSFREGKFDIFSLYWQRYLRLAPLMAVCALVIATVFPFFGSGPIWPARAHMEAAHCQQYWWSSMLYIQNYVNPRELVC